MKHLIVSRFSKVQQKWKSVKQLAPGRIDWSLGNLDIEDENGVPAWSSSSLEHPTKFGEVFF
jgi:hypothetical protein